MLPPGAAHAVRVPGGSARLLYITIGAPYDGFAREMSALYARGEASLENIVAVAHQHGLQLEGDASDTG
jgi:hypothetical protein